MSFGETIFLFVLALVVFGPKKLPEIARQVGKMLNEFRRASNEFKSQIEQEIAHLEVENKQTVLPPSSTPEGTESRSLVTLPSEPEPETRALATPLAEEIPSPTNPSEAAPTEPSPAPGDSMAATEAVTSSSSQESHA